MIVAIDTKLLVKPIKYLQSVEIYLKYMATTPIDNESIEKNIPVAIAIFYEAKCSTMNT